MTLGDIPKIAQVRQRTLSVAFRERVVLFQLWSPKRGAEIPARIPPRGQVSGGQFGCDLPHSGGRQSGSLLNISANLLRNISGHTS